MPNWCSNVIVIKGDSNKIKEILEKLESAEQYKVLENLIGLHPKANKDNWYETNVEWFGSKWDIDKEELNTESTEDSIKITPSSAWSPLVPACQRIAEKYGVSVDIKYFEPGMDFAGHCEFDETGTGVESEEYDYMEGLYLLDKEAFWDDLENTYLEEDVSDVSELDEYIENNFTYVDEEDIPKVKEKLTEVLNEAGE